MVKIDDKNKIDGQKQVRLVIEILGSGDNQSYLIRAENGMVISVTHNQVEFLSDIETIVTAFNANV